MEKVLFLLGGYDLEMITIREILKENNYTQVDAANYIDVRKGFADKKLSWGASIKEYEEYLDFPGKIFGIELTEPPGWIKPANYTGIDHHNELSHLPSSLEQVADLLGISLNRWLELVAANDKGYIPAMKEMSATDEEIQEVRRKDREAQGVIEEQERQAEESIENNLRWKNGVAVIKSLTEKFSPIADRMYGKADRLLIYDDQQMVYYGNGVKKIARDFSNLVQQKKAYWGGGENGYFGIAKGNFSADEIKKYVEQITEAVPA